MIEQKPHPVFAGLWVAWTVAMVTAVFLPRIPIFGLIVLVSFFGIEVPAAKLKSGGLRDTLSQITTWAVRKSAKTRLPLGFGAVLAADVLLIAFLVGRTFAHYSGSLFLGIGVGVLTVAFLWFHLMSPDVWG